MTIPKQAATIHTIRENIGRNLGVMTYGNTTALGTTATLIDTIFLAKGVTDEYIRQQVYITSQVAGGATIYSSSYVTAFATSTSTLTFAPVMGAAVKAGTDYELWRDFNTWDIHDFINQAITAATASCLAEKTDISLATIAATYAYAIPSGFVGIYMVEYLPSTGANYVQIVPDHWRIDRPNSKLMLTDTTLGITGVGKTLRLSGYRIPAQLTTASTSTDIDPEYIVAEVTSRVLLALAPSSDLDTQNRIAKANYWKGIANAKLKEIRTPIAAGTRWC